MRSKYLSELSSAEKEKLRKQLFDSQSGNCFICGKPMDLKVHGDSLEIDHIESLQAGGKDQPENFALAHARCNESKQASNLRVARLLAKFEEIKENAQLEKRDAVTLADVLKTFNGSRFNFKTNFDDSHAV